MQLTWTDDYKEINVENITLWLYPNLIKTENKLASQTGQNTVGNE